MTRSRPRAPALRILPGLGLLALLVLAWGQTPQRQNLEAAEPAESPTSRQEAKLWEAARERGQALADMEEGDYQSAAQHLEDLAQALPNNILPPINLAICYFRLNRPEEALGQLRRARALDPDNPQMLYTLARILEHEPGRQGQWRDVVGHFAARHPHDVRLYHLQAQAMERADRPAEAVPLLQQGLREEPENLVLLADLLVASAAAGEPESVVDAVNAIEDRLDGFEGSLADFAEQIRNLAETGATDGLRPPATIMRNLLRPTNLYQAHLVPLVGAGQVGAMFPQQDFDPPLPKSIQGGQDIAIRFADASHLMVLEKSVLDPLVFAPRPGVEGLMGVAGRTLVATAFEGESFASHELHLTPPIMGLAMIYAVDQDEIPDLVTADPGYGVRLYSGSPNGSFGPAQQVVGPMADHDFLGLYPLDVDHDGDLDLFVARRAAPDLYLQNNGDGSWIERAKELGIAGSAIDTTSIAVADFDDDGDLDLLTVHPTSHPRLYINPRVGAFREAPAGRGLRHVEHGYHTVRIGDFNGDGLFDLLLWGDRGSQLVGNRYPEFVPISLPENLPPVWSAAEPGDFDNDGDLDFVVTFMDNSPAMLVRNRDGELTAEPLDVTAPAPTSLRTGDFDDDGDLDLVVRLADGELRFWRNEGGNRNHWVRLSLKGRYENNAKNNVQGLFCRVEMRVGDTYVAALGNGGVNHLGLGARRQADVIRVVWTNGIAQTWQLVSADRTLVEEQMLKGSCPFLYTWSGEEFVFLTDLMWRSPLGMLLADGTPAPHQSARDFVMIPGEALRRSAGGLWLQITEELWETAYVDRQVLYAVDHPADMELVVDEKFMPPPHPRQAPIHLLGNRMLPTVARDHRGHDVLDRLRRRDGRYVDDLPLSRYQGLTDGHWLELGFGSVPAEKRLRLVLWGWIFPTDTSINFALAQNQRLRPEGPSLEILGEDGRWRPLSPFIGFPNGKRKAVVVELSGRLPTGEVRLRIRTSLQIYWDAALLAVGEPEAPPFVTPLEPQWADLHYRGFSRLYRESSTGPHLFDYSMVSHGARFRDMTGAFTRFGRVTELLQEEDDRYVVMNAGDEMTVRFDASRLPPLEHGWRRDYVLYTDGWVKDGDIHTAASQTVEPLPYHAMTAYPGGSQHRYPDSQRHRHYLERYQTRRVSDQPFRDALKN